MSNVKISGFPVPFALPTASAMLGTEVVPMDQTQGGVLVTVGATLNTIFGPIGINRTTGAVSITAPSSGTALSISTPDNVAALSFNDPSPVSGYYIGLSNAGVLCGAIGLGGIIGTGVALGDLAVNAITGTLRLGTGGAPTAVSVDGITTTLTHTSNPILLWNASAGAADTKQVRMYNASSGTLYIQSLNDANSVQKGILQVQHSGNVVSSMIYGNAADNTAHAFYGPVTINTPSSGTALSVSGIIDATQAVRSTGASPPTSGTGLEIACDGTNGYVTAYNRTGSVYIPLLIRGLTVSLAPSGVAALTAVSAGNVTIVSPSSGVALTVNGNTTNNTLTLANAAGQPAFIGFNGNASVQGFIGTAGAANNLVTGSSVGDLVIRSQGGTVRVSANSGTSTQLAVTSTTVGILGAAGSAQVTGWGTPTGPAVVANFSGTAATLVQCSNAIAKIITDLKSLGLYGA